MTARGANKTKAKRTKTTKRATTTKRTKTTKTTKTTKAKRTKKTASPSAPYEAELAALDKRLAAATDVTELSSVARAYHSVGYSIGHDIPAIIANVELPTLANRGELVANERCADACATDGNLKHALFHLFEALELADSREDRERIGGRATALLENYDHEAARRIRDCLAALPADEEQAASVYMQKQRTLKDFDWDGLPIA